MIDGGGGKWAAVCHLTKRFSQLKEYLNNYFRLCLLYRIGGGYAALLCLPMYCGVLAANGRLCNGIACNGGAWLAAVGWLLVCTTKGSRAAGCQLY